MYRGKKKSKRRLVALLFICLLVVSIFLPQLGHATEVTDAETTGHALQLQDVALEKEREKEYRENELLEGTPGEVKLTSILNGLGWEAPPLGTEEKEEHNTDEKLEGAVLDQLEENGMVNIIVRLKDKPDVEGLFEAAKEKKQRVERVREVKKQLETHAEASQKGIEKALVALEERGHVKNKSSLWVINGLSMTVDKAALEELKMRDDIEKITLDKIIEIEESKVEDSKPNLPEWGLEKIFATKVWGDYGLRGKGIVIGIMDSGVDYKHEALAHNYRGRDGEHQYSWIDVSGQNYAVPSDGFGHGTHVAGTAVGGGNGAPIGVAPEAEWIAAKIFTDGGAATTSGIHRAFEWFMAPGGDPSKAPHIVNNSWGSAATYNTEFYEDVKAWIAAGIFPLFAGGNDGPGSQTIGSPGSFPESFTIGATDINDQVASFSSRGPVYWTDEAGNSVRFVKPDVSAPGHQIYSAWPGVKGEGKYRTLSGTSMATPHVAGSIALLLQANPNLSVDNIKDLLQRTARVEPYMGNLPNDQYGNGIVNIYQAVTETAFAGKLTGTVDGVEGVPVTIHIPSQEVKVEVTDGMFDIAIREGTHQVKVEAFGYQTLKTEVTIKKGEETRVEWMLEPAVAFEISGKVMEKNSGVPVPFAYVRLKGTPLQTVRTDSQGEFVVEQVPEGIYELMVTGEGIEGTSMQMEVKGVQQLIIEVVAIASEQAPNWTTVNNNYQRNAVSPYGIDVNVLGSSWEYATGTKGQILFSSPAANDRFVIFTTERGWVTALDTETGEEAWSIRLGSTNRSSPTIVENTLFVSGGQDGNIYALDLASGNMKWSKRIGQPSVYESPIYHDGTVYVGSGLTENPSVYALDADNGNIIWSTELGGASFFGGAMGEGYLFYGSYENMTLRALDMVDGSIAWSTTLSDEGFASKPVFHQGKVYVQSSNFGTGSGTLHAINASTGEIVWQKTGIGDSQAGSPIVFEDMVIAGSSNQPILRAFHKDTGDVIWSNRSVGTTMNNGSVTANGILFFAGTSGYIHAIDAYSGSVLKDFTLPDYSTSGVAVLAGNVLVPHRNGIISFQAPGILEGTISGMEGEVVEATVSVKETKSETDAFENGTYSFKHKPGDYTLKVASYGKKQIEQEIRFVSGFTEKRDFVLEDAETGSLSLIVKDKRTAQPLEAVKVTVQSTPLEEATSSAGTLIFEEVYEGTFLLELSLNGYKKVQQEVVIKAGESTVLEIQMQPFDIAVLDDWEGEVTTILNRNGFLAEERNWDIVEDIFRYEVVYLNGAYGSEGWKPDAKLFIELIEKAREHDVNLVFADSWGANYGSVGQLVEFTEDPKELAHFYGMGQVRMQVDVAHPIFKDLEQGERVTLFTRTGEFAWFNQYSGRHIATIGSTTQGMKGSGVAYKAVSENSAHLLLSNLGASPWISPLQGWLPDMQSLLFNGLRFLTDTEFGAVTGTVMNAEGTPVQAEIGIVETNVSTMTEGETASFELFHDEGVYTLEIRAEGYATQTQQVNIEHGHPEQVTIVLTSTNGDKISGFVSDGMTKQPQSDALVKLIKDNTVVVEEVTPANGRFEFTGLEYGTYVLLIEKEGYIQVKQSIEVGRAQEELQLEMFPTPRVAVIGDYWQTEKNFESTMMDEGIPVTELSLANASTEVGNYDVVFVNEVSTSTMTKAVFENLMKKADEAQTSIIFGDSYFVGSGINHLVRHREDPEVRSTISNTTKSAGYIVEEEHTLFTGRAAGDFIELLIPSGSRIAAFDNYSGYTIASVAHEGNPAFHGGGIAYKPRTSGSMELLMSAHGFGTYHHKDHYTDGGKQLLVDAVLWAAYSEFNAITGVITDEEGNPLQASVKVEGTDFQTRTDPETGQYSIAIKDGEYQVEVESYGYDKLTIPVTVNAELEPLLSTMNVDDAVGSIAGQVQNENDGSSVTDVTVEVIGVPRETVSAAQGRYTLERLMPGTYDIMFKKEGYIHKKVQVEIGVGENLELNVTLRSSPTIGVIVDSTSSGSVTMKDYLEGKGYKVLYMHYTDLDVLGQVDLVIANSDYDNSKIPTAQEFKAFQQALNLTETSVIWTGQNGGRGSIRYLYEYEENPSVEFKGSSSGAQAVVKNEHPIVEGVPLNEAFPVKNNYNYHYAFDGYDGVSLVDHQNASGDRLGSMIAYKGRTVNSVEILLANFTFSASYHPGAPDYFDPVRERILINSIDWAIYNQESITGELYGTVKNEQDMPLQAKVTVQETGRMVETNQQGEFYLSLAEGSYTVSIESFGHLTKEFSVDIQNGETLQETFVLSTDQGGVITATLRDAITNEPIEGGAVTIIGTPVTGTTDHNGQFQAVVPVGTYSVRATAPGYAANVQDGLMVENGGEVNTSFLLQTSEKIAVVATSLNGNRIKGLLDQRGYDSELILNNNMQQLIDNLSDYALVIFNDKHSSMTSAQFQAFIAQADQQQVSIIFASQYSGGTIRDLSDITGDPSSVRWGYEVGQIQVKVLHDHPIFDGFMSEYITILSNGTSSQQYFAYDAYSGTTIGEISHSDKGVLGKGIGYKFSSANSVHVLLSGLQAGSYGHPESRWTNEAKQLYFNAIDWAISASLGEVNGKVTNAEGEGIPNAVVKIEALGMETRTNTLGHYRLGVGTGTYELEVIARGYEEQTKTVEITQLGEAVVADFELLKVDGVSISLSTTDVVTGVPLEGATVRLTALDDSGLKDEGVTDELGAIRFGDLLAGDYEITVEKEGYLTHLETLSLTNEDLEISVALNPIRVAVLEDWNSQITNFLNEEELYAEARDWGMVDDISNYELVVVNSKNGTKEELQALMEAAQEYEVSLVFVGTWGIGEGSIPLLGELEGYPQLDQQGYNEGAVKLQIQPEHPIYKDITADEKGYVAIHSEKSPYSTFKDYPGIVVGSMVVDDQSKGTAIAYQYKGKNHMQLLLSSFAVTNVIGPNSGWTEDGRKIFIQALEFAMNMEQPVPGAPVWEEKMIRTGDKPVKVTGHGEPFSTVHIYLEKGKERIKLTSVEVGADGSFQAELFLKNGSNNILAQTENYSGVGDWSDKLEIIIIGKPLDKPGIPRVPEKPSKPIIIPVPIEPVKPMGEKEMHSSISMKLSSIEAGMLIEWNDIGADMYEVFIGGRSVATVIDGLQFLDIEAVDDPGNAVYHVVGYLGGKTVGKSEIEKSEVETEN